MSDKLHHANLLVGDIVAAESYAKGLGLESNDPDFIIFREALFGIDEARRLSALADRKAFGIKKTFLILPERITLEAQNALLKTFEDPSSDTYFYLVVKNAELIIPTLRSRMNVIRGQNRVLATQEAKDFLKLSVKERMDFVKKFVDEEKNLPDFLDELLLTTKSEKVYKLRLFADDRSASARLILEHLAVVL